MVVDRVIEDWVPSLFQQHVSIDVGNQYFTAHKHVLQYQPMAFSAGIDIA